MSDLKLPVFSTVGLSLHWTLEVVKRHWVLVLLYMVVGTAVFIVPFAIPFMWIAGGQPIGPWPLLGFAVLPLFILAEVFLALITHNEVLRGAGGFDAATFGPGGRRLGGYILDALVLFGVALGCLVVIGGLAILLLKPGPMANGPVAMVLGAGFGIWLVLVCVLTRMGLRFPSRALGEPLPWGEVWRLSRGNTWRIIAGLIVLGIVGAVANWAVSLPIQAVLNPGIEVKVQAMLSGWRAGAPVSPWELVPDTMSRLALAWSFILNGVAATVGVIVPCAFLSVVYATLRPAPQDAAAPIPPAGRLDPTF